METILKYNGKKQFYKLSTPLPHESPRVAFSLKKPISKIVFFLSLSQPSESFEKKDKFLLNCPVYKSSFA